MRKGGGNGGLWKARKTIVPCFPTFPQTLEIARRMHRKMEIMQSDSHIPSAPAASINFISRKDKTRFAYPSPPSGSSLDWKRLSQRINVVRAPPIILTGSAANHTSESIAYCVYMDRILR